MKRACPRPVVFPGFMASEFLRSLIRVIVFIRSELERVIGGSRRG